MYFIPLFRLIFQFFSLHSNFLRRPLEAHILKSTELSNHTNWKHSNNLHVYDNFLYFIWTIFKCKTKHFLWIIADDMRDDIMDQWVVKTYGTFCRKYYVNLWSIYWRLLLLWIYYVCREQSMCTGVEVSASRFSGATGGCGPSHSLAHCSEITHQHSGLWKSNQFHTLTSK